MLATIIKTTKGVLDYSLELRQILSRFDGQEVLIEVSKVPSALSRYLEGSSGWID
jgi:hypothetical protein